MSPDDLADLTELFEDKGPFLTVYLSGPDPVPDQRDLHRRRWQAARRSLEDRGIDQPTLDVLDAAVLEGVPRPGSTLGVIASADGGVRMRALLPGAEIELTDVGPVPRMVPMLKWRQDHPPALLVIADHAGADIWEIAGAELNAAGHLFDDDPERHRGQPGGWSQRRFQQRAENLWEDSAREVADAVADLARSLDARAVVVAGEPHSLHYLEEHLAADLRDRVRRLDHGSRAPGSDLERLLEAAGTEIATVVAEGEVAVLERFAEERGQNDKAADGPEATLAALSRHQVDTLLVHDDPADDRRAFAGDEGRQVHLEASALRDLGLEPHEGRLIDLAVRAALLSGASIAVVPGHGPNTPTGDLGGLLRFADQPQ